VEVRVAGEQSVRGAILRVDLGDGRTEEIPTGEYARRFLGGRGVATAIYWNEVPPGIDPLDERNRLIVSVGPLAGFPGLGGSRWGVFAKSPQPAGGRFCYGNLGGGFGAELKFAGYDGLVLRGKADGPVVLSIRDREVRLRKADELWGTTTTQTIASLFPALEFLVQLLRHLPNARAHLVRRYGLYSSLGRQPVAQQTAGGPIPRHMESKALAGAPGPRGMAAAARSGCGRHTCRGLCPAVRLHQGIPRRMGTASGQGVRGRCAALQPLRLPDEGAGSHHQDGPCPSRS